MDQEDKKKKLEDEYNQRKEEIAKLKFQAKSTQDDILMIEEKLEQLQNRIQISNTELNVRKRRLNDLQNQFKSKSQEKNEEHEDSSEEDLDAKAEQELKIKMLKLISNRQELDIDPNELFFYDGQRSEIKSNIAIHTVKIKLVQSEEQSSQKAFTKIVPKDCTFRIHKKMTFPQLKEKACEHWMINPVGFSLYTLNFQYLDSDKLESCIEQHLNKNSIYPELWLLENAQYANKPDQFIDDPLASKSTLKINRNLNLTKAEKDFEVFKEVMENYYHLKYFLPPVEAKPEETEIKGLHGRDTSCCAFVFLILLLGTTLSVITDRRNIGQEFWTREKVYKRLKPIEFHSIVDQNSAVDWIYSGLGPTFFLSSDEEKDQVIDYYKRVGPLVMKQGRSKQKDCLRDDLSFNKTFAKCYYKNVKGSEKLTSSIYVGTEAWRTYHSSTDFKNSFVGKFGEYDTSGYVQEFEQEYFSEFQSEFKKMIENNWIAESTRVIFISANLYQPTYDLWVIVAIVIEFSTNSYAYPSQIEVVALQPNIVTKYAGSALADVFRIIFSLYILYIYIFTILEFHNGRRNIQHIISFQGLMDLFLIVMIIFSVGVSLLINKDEKSIYKDDKFEDLSSLINYYRLYHNSNSISLTLIVVRLLMFLTLNKRVFIYITTIRMGAKSMLSFFACLLLMMLGFTMIAQSLYGIYIYDYHSFIYTMINLLLYSMSHGKFDEMMKIDIHWTAFFLAVFFIIIVFFLVCTFAGIFMDAYKVVRLTEGYDDEKTTWTVRHFAMWLVDWLPPGIKRKIFYRKEKGKGINEAEDVDGQDDDDDEAQE